MSIECLLCRTYRPPEPPRTPGISPTPSSITYHPYAQNPSALTEYLKQKLRQQQAKRLSHSHPTQVEQSVPLECNILVAWCIVKDEQGLCISICQAIKDVDHVVDLSKQVVSCEPSFPVLARPEDDLGFTATRSG